ncbi:N-acetylneuraminate synthase family protein [Haloarcula halophila]|uniref:N-acetylneuraminate synthase family protein n=1 Tax=Haloarcula TaxID=2237 RepID=UPI0023E3B3F3|nr:N-acetylneuraminate synthase family protein [Halomicroarcula sp. DFY41]
MQIDGRVIEPYTDAYIIAEIGSTHNGEFERAKKSIDAAAAAGADAVKFQLFRADEMYTDAVDQEVYDHVVKIEVPYDWIPELAAHAEEQDVTFLTTPFDTESVDELDPYVPAFKVGSSSLSHVEFMQHLAGTGKPILASTGAQDLDDVRDARDTLTTAGCSEFAFLHCVSAYPTPLEDINVRAVATLREEFGDPVGFSDHTLDPGTAPTAAVALGASIVEKHFTLDRSQDGPDHSHSLEPDEFETMVDAIRATERALGTGAVTITDIERDWYEDARRSVQATRDLSAGETITSDDVGVHRSVGKRRGVDAKQIDTVLGATLVEPVAEGDGITEDLIERDGELSD